MTLVVWNNFLNNMLNTKEQPKSGWKYREWRDEVLLSRVWGRCNMILEAMRIPETTGAGDEVGGGARRTRSCQQQGDLNH
jgi:hypothetical protein